MIAGIAQISEESSRAAVSALNAFEESLDMLESALRGTTNTTVTSDRKNRISPPSLSESQKIIDPNTMDLLLSRVRTMPQVREGSFTVNSTVIPVDPARDSFEDIVQRINASSEGVMARYDIERNRFSLYAKNGSKDISLLNDTSNFLMEVNVQPGTYHVSTDAPMYGLRTAERSVPHIYSAFENVHTTINTIMQNKEVPDEIKTTIRTVVKDTIADATDQSREDDRAYLNWGVDINFQKEHEELFAMSDAALYALRNDSTEQVRFYSGDSTHTGLVQRAYAALDSLNKGLYINQEV